MSTILVTGGAGFIGSALVRQLIADTTDRIVTLDALTYAGNLASLGDALHSVRHTFVRADVTDVAAVRRVFEQHQPDLVFHLAAESHVDRSIDGPAAFVHTNVVGTSVLLTEALRYWRSLDERSRTAFRLLHVSTDEVFGSLGDEGKFRETTAYDPSSPYAATKAGSDHLVRAWHRTYGLPILITNCSNNYGPYQFPEKLIPLMIGKARAGEPLPVYGTGANVRDWLYVDDHARALRTVAARGTIGATYCVGGNAERSNLEVVRSICAILDELAPRAVGPHEALVTFVDDRPGHDHRYAIDASLIRRELGWVPAEGFSSGLRRTVEWYLANDAWVADIHSGRYRGERLGLAS